MIKIISGIYGRTNPKTSKDDPFSLTPKEEKRLVDRGVAAYITGGTAPDLANETDPLAYNMDMTLRELVEVAGRYGVDASKMRKKAEVIAAIDAVVAEKENNDPPDGENDPPDDNGGGDNEQPPVGTVDPV